jgi:hypothetical protein
MWLVVRVAVVCVVLSIPSVLAAQPCPPVDVNLSMDEPTQQWWMVLLDFFVRISAPLVTAVVGVLGAWVVRKLTAKWETEKQEAVGRLVDGFVVAGVALAEEQARKVLRVSGLRTPGVEKLQTAVNRVEDQIRASGLPEIMRSEITSLVESRLQMERAKPDGIVPSDPVGGDR